MNKHVPIPSRSRIFSGMVFARDEVVKACDELKADAARLERAVSLMSAAFDAERQVDCKVACEQVAQAAGKISDRRAQQIATLANSLAGTLSVHLNRKARA